MGQIWEDCWGSAVQIFWIVQSEVGIPPVQEPNMSDLIHTRKPMMGFIAQKMECMGEVPEAGAELEPVEVMLHSSTINQVHHICWVLGCAGGET